MSKLYIKDNIIRPGNRIDIRRECNGRYHYIVNPSEEDILTDGWVEYVAPVPESWSISPDELYKQRVAELIHEKYTTDDEIAILRQRDCKADEFEEYNRFVEQCKHAARTEVYGGCES